jgi:hypothetical protein
MAVKATALRIAARPGPVFGRPSDRLLRLLLLSTSATGSFGCIGLWIAGHGYLGLRLLSGSVLFMVGLLLA